MNLDKVKGAEELLVHPLLPIVLSPWLIDWSKPGVIFNMPRQAGRKTAYEKMAKMMASE